ncbi:MAG: hypothetical protein J6P94_04235 [Oscillospiraceae bacterium]|nr:hypothetical protein [Oscillospiraceae bacterium]
MKSLTEELDMMIDGVPLTSFGGRLLLDYTIGGSPMDNAIYHGVNRTNWIMLKSRFGLRELSLNIVFTGRTLYECKLNRSRFNAAVRERCELYIPGDDFYYTAYCKDFGSEERIGEGDAEAQIKSSYEFEGIRHGLAVAVTIDGGDSVWCDGTAPFSDARLTATVGTTGTNYTLGGAVFSSVTAGDVLVFDGIDCKITKNGVNCAGSVEWVHFPALIPGYNTIACADPVTVYFAPAYL